MSDKPTPHALNQAYARRHAEIQRSAFDMERLLRRLVNGGHGLFKLADDAREILDRIDKAGKAG